MPAPFRARRGSGSPLPFETRGPAATASRSGDTLEGVVERVVYLNEENGWSVIRLDTGGGRIETAVGRFAHARVGETLRLRGRWTVDRRFGEQFQADSCLTLRPATLAGLEKYLASGLVPGIGPVMAARLVRHFGIETLDVIEGEPERLAEVEGIGPQRSERIRRAWTAQKALRDVMVFLHAHAVSAGQAVRIYRQYGDRSVALLRENPYRLAADVFGIGFRTADRIAARLGIPADSPRRVEAAALHALAEASDEGHMFLPRALLAERTERLLESRPPSEAAPSGDAPAAGAEAEPSPAGGENPAGRIQEAFARLREAGRVVVEPAGASAGEAEDAVYTASHHLSESASARLLAALISTPPRPLSLDLPRAVVWFERETGLRLGEKQREALGRAGGSKLLVLTGGPGTGKTTLVNAFIRILERKDRRILLCAPTGRAAKRLCEATGREAKTIHRMLEFEPRAMAFQRNETRPLEADLLVVDEASMVDAVLLPHLLRALPAACQLVLVGDVDQLPSVGPGSVLRDVIRSGAADVVWLGHIYRQKSGSLIVLNAHRVNQGRMPLTGDDGGDEADRDFFFIAREEPEQVLATIRELVAERIPSRFGLDPVDDIQVLAPMQKGLLGVANLNRELRELLNPAGRAAHAAGRASSAPPSTAPPPPSGDPSPVRFAARPSSAIPPAAETPVAGPRSFRPGDKVMQIRNNYELEVFNGDIGRIAELDGETGELLVRYEDRTVLYKSADLDELALAYACSVHKAQGSESPAVVIPLHTQHYVMLQRNLLYTAITRGRRLVVLVGSRRALGTAVRNDRIRLRHTKLAERLGALVGARGG